MFRPVSRRMAASASPPRGLRQVNFGAWVHYLHPQGEGTGAHAGAGPGHELQRDVAEPQIHPLVHPFHGDKVVQDRVIGVFHPGGTGLEFFLGASLGFFVVERWHMAAPHASAVENPGNTTPQPQPVPAAQRRAVKK